MRMDVSRPQNEPGIPSERMRMQDFLKVALAMVSLLAVALPASSQINLGRIVGTVSDPSGAAISAASITITNMQTGASQLVTTQSDGGFVAPALSPGTYSVRAEAKGFQTGEYKDVVVQVGSATRVDVSLKIGAASQTVTVNELVPLVGHDECDSRRDSQQ